MKVPDSTLLIFPASNKFKIMIMRDLFQEISMNNEIVE